MQQYGFIVLASGPGMAGTEVFAKKVYPTIGEAIQARSDCVEELAKLMDRPDTISLHAGFTAKEPSTITRKLSQDIVLVSVSIIEVIQA